MLAAEKGHAQVVKLLLSQGAKTDLKDRTDWTAIMHAAEEGRLEVVSCSWTRRLALKQKARTAEQSYLQAAERFTQRSCD